MGALRREYGLQRTRYLGCAKVKPVFPPDAMAFNLNKVALMLEPYARKGIYMPCNYYLHSPTNIVITLIG